MKLNLGCSTDLRGGDWINVDLVNPERSTSGVTGGTIQLADLDFPWPWENSSVDEIYAADIFEHLHDVPTFAFSRMVRHSSARIHAMNESWRVLKPGGLLTIECPDAAKGAGQWQDPTHVTPWTPNGLQYFADGSAAHQRFAKAYGINARFKILGVDERLYTEVSGGTFGAVRCEVWKFSARLEAIK